MPASPPPAAASLGPAPRPALLRSAARSCSACAYAASSSAVRASLASLPAPTCAMAGCTGSLPLSGVPGAGRAGAAATGVTPPLLLGWKPVEQFTHSQSGTPAWLISGTCRPEALRCAHCQPNAPATLPCFATSLLTKQSGQDSARIVHPRSRSAPILWLLSALARLGDGCAPSRSSEVCILRECCSCSRAELDNRLPAVEGLCIRRCGKDFEPSAPSFQAGS